ncbi:MAG: glycosyl hydrolase [Anaerolineales bacterium]
MASSQSQPNSKRKTLPALAGLMIAGALLLQAQAPASAAAAKVEQAPATPAHTIFLPLTGGANTTIAPEPVETTSQIYWGAMVDGQAPSPERLALFAEFEQQAGKQMAILHWGEPWKMDGDFMPFQTSYFNNVRSRGSIPMLDWGSWNLGDGKDQPAFRLSTIAAGAYDSYIQQWARDAKAWGHPFFLRFDWEMNGNWQFPWAEQINGNQSGDYIQAWRHVHDIFTANGASNATWVWCPNIGGSTTRDLAALYPGDNYVDWTCLDGYNKYDTWLSFNTVFSSAGINWLDNSYADLVALAPSKPIMIGETGSLEAGDGGAKKADWIRKAFSSELTTSFPQIKAVVLFDWNDNSSKLATLPINSTPASQAAFAQSISSSLFASNDFAGLNTAKVQPLP